VERSELTRLERMIDREVKARFAPGTVRRVAVLQHGDDPAIEPEELLVRVFIEAGGGPEDQQRSLDVWAEDHQTGMKRMRRELSLRLPPARLLEFTVDTGDPAAPRITMPDDPALTNEQLPPREIVHIALAELRAMYVFPDRAEQAATAIEARLAAGEYDDLGEAELAERLTSQLEEVCADKHLRVRAMPPRPPRPGPAGPRDRPGQDEPVPEGGEPEPGRGEPGPRRRGPGPGPGGRERGHPLNYGIERVERLAGNVGYLDLRGMAPPEHAGQAIAAAMELVTGTYALIIDLRRNHGGSPHGVAFWSSYLFPGADTHLSDIFHADTGETEQFWTLPYVPGARYLDQPVYMLTSHETFSGGEDFCYSVQAQGRAEVIGETTGGGAHPTRMVPISATLAIGVPFARSVNPVTGTNWQGTGVLPDVAVPAAEAYDVAYGKALRHVLSIDVPPPIADEAREALAALPGNGQEGPP
jgi:Peptidase family S41/N-terminal domain of Peptidase_S41 in eukaryotic IRBP